MKAGLIVISMVLVFWASACAPLHLGPELKPEGVVFSLYAPNVKSVAIAGSFNAWDINKDILNGPDNKGMWSITIPLRLGRYEYLFVIDGRIWQRDPAVPEVDDGFGGKNSVFVVPEGNKKL